MLRRGLGGSAFCQGEFVNEPLILSWIKSGGSARLCLPFRLRLQEEDRDEKSYFGNSKRRTTGMLRAASLLSGSSRLLAPTAPTPVPRPVGLHPSPSPALRVSVEPGNGVGEYPDDLPFDLPRVWRAEKTARQMASQWRGRGAAVRQRRSLLKEEPLEKEMKGSSAGHLEASTGALGALCKQFQRRLPLKAVSLNLRAGPSWKRLETPEPAQQGLQAAARSAKNALGAMSQKIQESCHSGTKWLAETQVRHRRRKRAAQKGSGSPTLSLNHKSSRLSRARPGLREREYHSPCAHPQRRSRREATFRSPYSSREPLCSPSESDSDPEPVGAGIQHLQKLSQKLDRAIVAEESGDMSISLIRD